MTTKLKKCQVALPAWASWLVASGHLLRGLRNSRLCEPFLSQLESPSSGLVAEGRGVCQMVDRCTSLLGEDNFWALGELELFFFSTLISLARYVFVSSQAGLRLSLSAYGCSPPPPTPSSLVPIKG